MNESTDVDITFDFRSDTPPKRDPDARSPTLRKYHRILWSKPLPSGVRFDLATGHARVYLHHKSSAGEFSLASDSVIPTFVTSSRIAHIIAQIPSDVSDRFDQLSYTIGGMMVFPGNKIDGGMTINGARGCHYLIKDRFDLTLECIRKYYHDEQNPLTDTLNRYGKFFDLFASFQGYVEFFLLQDLVAPDFSCVKFFLPFEGFQPWPLPKDVAEYHEYRLAAEAFLHARNQRILKDHAVAGTTPMSGSFAYDV